MFIFITLPLFLLGLKFWTAPAYLRYKSKLNTILAPIAFIPIFYSNHIDMVFLGLLSCIMNCYVLWYHSDPPPMPKDFTKNPNQR